MCGAPSFRRVVRTATAGARTPEGIRIVGEMSRPAHAVSLLAIGVVCASAPGAAAAVVTGTAPDGTRYRLDGKRISVHLRARARVVKVTCGDLAGVTPTRAARPVWADVSTAAVRSHDRQRLVTVRLTRDLSARASLCFVTRRGEDAAAPRKQRRARMRLRSGTSAGCRPGRYEKTVLSIGPVDVLYASRGGLALRACRAGDARPIALFADVPGRMQISVGPFAVSGDVLGWNVYREKRSGEPLATAGATNLATGARIGVIHPEIRVAELAVSAAGVVACIERSSFADTASATLLARRPGGEVVTLDSSPGNDLAGLTVSGTTVSWLHDGQPRSSSVG